MVKTLISFILSFYSVFVNKMTVKNYNNMITELPQNGTAIDSKNTG